MTARHGEDATAADYQGMPGRYQCDFRRRPDALQLTYAAATEGTDYQRTTGTLTFRPGAQRRTITVPLVDDGAEEERELFQVRRRRRTSTPSRRRVS